MTAPTAGLVQVKVFVRFSVVLVRFMRVRTRLPWVFDEITTPVEKQFGPPLPIFASVYGHPQLPFSSTPLSTQPMRG